MTSAATASYVAIRDSYANLSADNFINGFETTSFTAASTVQLSPSSKYFQKFTGTGSSSHEVRLPTTNTLAIGQSYKLINRSTKTISLQGSGGDSDLSYTIPLDGEITLVCTDIINNLITSWEIMTIVTKTGSFTGSLVGDVTGTQGATKVEKINGTSLAVLSTGLLKNTTTTGVPSIAVAGTDYVSPSLASTKIWVGNASGAATPVSMTGDASISNIGVVTISNIAGSVTVNGLITGNGGLTTTGTSNVSVGSDAAAQIINIGTGGASKVVTIGSTNSLSPTTVNSGTSGLSLNSLGNATLNSAGNISIDGAPAGSITIGDAAQTGAISIGTSSAAHTTNIGVATSTAVSTVNIATGGTAANVISIGNGTNNATNILGTVSATRFKGTHKTYAGAATLKIDLSLGNFFTVTLGTNTAFDSTWYTNQGVGTYSIRFLQDGTGSRTVAFPSTWVWSGGVIPTITSTANKSDIVTLYYDGTTFYATIIQNF